MDTFNARGGHYFGANMFGHNSAGDRARELFKPSKDEESLVVTIKKIGMFWIWAFLWVKS